VRSRDARRQRSVEQSGRNAQVGSQGSLRLTEIWRGRPCRARCPLLRAPTSTRDISSGRRGGLRSGTARTKGRTYEQLYNEARAMNVHGRSKMNKAQLQRAVDGRKGRRG